MAPQKRCAQEADSLLGGVKAVIVDIEGTTTPISFVKVKYLGSLRLSRLLLLSVDQQGTCTASAFPCNCAKYLL